MASSDVSTTGNNSIEAIKTSLTERGIHSLLVQFCDLHGVAKGKLVPVAQLAQWVNEGAGFAGPSIDGTGLPRMGPRSEYYGRADLTTVQDLPFFSGVARVVCDGFAGGEPLATCSRQVLRRQVARLAERGWTLQVGVEPEFFLLRPDGKGRWEGFDPQDQLNKPSYDLKAIGRQMALLQDLRQTLVDLDFKIEQIDHEDACSQYEVNYRHDHAIAAADRYMLFKLATHEIAQRHGALFSCMPKPFEGSPGSGLHFHLSLTDQEGRPVFSDAAGLLGLSTAGQSFAAGLLHHANALCAISAPTVNSYKRLRVSESASGTTWSPVWNAWGANNRTCILRVVSGRLEWRLPDPSCNIYAALAGVIASGLDGIDQGMVAPSPCDDDLYQLHALGMATPARLPRDLLQALDALNSDQVLTEQIGHDFCVAFQSIKRREWDEYAGCVSDWEMQRYAALF